MPRPVATISQGGFVLIPPSNLGIFAMKVTRSNAIVDDITERFTDTAAITLGVSEIIGNFEVKVDNSDDIYTNNWVIGDKFEVFLDYTNGTTKIFRGKIEAIDNLHESVKITGRAKHADLLDVNVTKAYSNVEASTIILDLMNSAPSGYTTTNVTLTSGRLITISFVGKPLWDALVETAKAAIMDIYVDQDLDVHLFDAGSINNVTESLAERFNIPPDGVEGFADDSAEIRNVIRVYGQKVGNVPLFYTAIDAVSIATYGRKEEEITDTNSRSMDEVRLKAEAVLAQKKNPPIIGSVKCHGLLAGLREGENLLIAAQSYKFELGYYKVQSFTHNFSSYETTVSLEKEKPKISFLFKKRISNEQETAGTDNPYGLAYSYNLFFDDESQTSIHSNTQISAGFLKTTTGSPGTFTSTAVSTLGTVDEVEARISGSLIENVAIEVSANNGSGWQTISPNTLTALTNQGNKLVVRITINNADTGIDSIAILYSIV